MAGLPSNRQVRVMVRRTIGTYTREIRPLLHEKAFEPSRSRLWWLPVHLAVVAGSTAALALHVVAWPIAALLSICIGLSYSGLTFLAHETLHGAVVRGKTLRRLVGFLGFLPFVISPRLWQAWHNRVHHGKTNQGAADPDAYPTLAAYRSSRAVRWATEFASPGLKRLRGALALLVGFSVQSLHMLVVASKRGFLSRQEQAYAIAETAFGLLLWASLARWIGVGPFLFAFVIPLFIGNAVVMGFILTNHTLSPLTSVNDPLANSLTVTVPRLLQWLTLGFGFHVEHHLFPAMSARHAPAVRRLLQARWPNDYQSMPLLRATLALHSTPRVYKDAVTLVDPRSGREVPALVSVDSRPKRRRIS